MPVARFEMPDGRVARFEVPEGTTPEQAQALISKSLNQPKPKGSTGRDAVGGLTRSGMGVVSNLMRPFEALIPGGNDFDSGHKERMGRVDARFRAQGYDPESLAFQGAKLAGDVAITTPVGGTFAKLVPYIPGLAKTVPALPTALRSGGFTLGKPAATTATGKAGDWALRTAGGATTGAASAGLLNADDAATGGLLGAAMPAAFKAGGEAGLLVADKVIKPAARRLMQSAVKPTIEQLRKGDAQVAIQTLLDYGISPTQKGVEKLRSVVDDINANITQKIANSPATVSRSDVVRYTDDVANRFGNQVSPTADINAIRGVADDFMAHPAIQGDAIPVQLAQKLKQGTYKALSGKYGEVGSAATEAQKALARGLKDKIAEAVLGIGPLNAEEAKLLRTLSVAERRALMELNKNPVGLSALASNPAGFAAFMADRSAAFKALAARAVNQAAKAPAFLPQAADAFSNPLLRSGVLAAESNRIGQQ